jgi:uncharacterized protein (DUF1330 family)
LGPPSLIALVRTLLGEEFLFKVALVLVEFPDGDSARAWYDSPEYQPLKAIRHRAARNNAVLIES